MIAPYKEPMSDASQLHVTLSTSQLHASALQSSPMTMQVVPKGTNGGVSSLGTLCGVAGSLLMGITFWLSGLLTLLKGATMPAMPCIMIALFGGVVGNFIDSLLGATLQYSGYSRTKHCIVTAPGPSVDRICGQSLLSNSQVNLVSSLVTCGMTSWFAVQIL